MLLVWMTTGCASGPKDAAGAEQPATLQSFKELRGVTLRLKRFVFEGKARKILPDSDITLHFAERERVDGYAGVNRFFGSYALDSVGVIRWAGTGFGTTRRAGPPNHMTQERLFLDCLHRTTRAVTTPKGLAFTEDDPEIRLEFEQAPR